MGDFVDAGVDENAGHDQPCRKLRPTRAFGFCSILGDIFSRC
jgi:hypothetical protein